MALLTRSFIEDLGIKLDDTTYEALSEHFQETLDDRVVREIVEELTPEQASELAALRDANDNQIYQWLMDTIGSPILTQIISDEVDILLGEIAENADRL